MPGHNVVSLTHHYTLRLQTSPPTFLSVPKPKMSYFPALTEPTPSSIEKIPETTHAKVKKSKAGPNKRVSHHATCLQF